MSTISSYPTRTFKESQKFLVLDPDTQSTSLVSGRDLVEYITPQSTYVFAEQSRAVAQNEDYQIGALIQTAGDLTAGDNFAGTFLVVPGGGGDFPMANGNDLLIIKGDILLREQLASNAPGSGSDLIAHTGTSDTVTQALDKRVIYVGSVAELKAVTTAVGTNVYLTQEGRAGDFVIKSGTPPSDPQEGIYVVLDNGNYAERIFSGAVKLEWFGVSSGGNITSAFSGALALSRNIKLPPFETVANSILPSIPAGAKISGHGVGISVIKKNFTGSYLIPDIASDVLFSGFEIDGNTNSSGLVRFETANTSLQVFENLKIHRDNGPAVSFNADSAIGFVSDNLKANTLTSGSAAISQTGTDTNATSRHFTNTVALGGTLFDFSGMNDAYAFGGYSGGFYSSSTSSKYLISNMRFAARGDGSRHEIRGENVFVTECVFSGPVDVYATDSVVYSLMADWEINDFGTGNSIFQKFRNYTPAVTNDTGDFSLGNGSVLGTFSREGNKVKVNINLNFGSTTVPGTGTYRFSLPSGLPSPLSQAAIVQVDGAGFTRDTGAGGDYALLLQIETSPSPFASLYSINSSGSLLIIQGSTKSWASTSKFRFSFEYIVV